MEIDNNIDRKDQDEREEENKVPNPDASMDGKLDPEDAKFSNDQNTDEIAAKKQ